jgi:allantoin racemase
MLRRAAQELSALLRLAGNDVDGIRPREGRVRVWFQSAVEMEGAPAYRQALQAHFARVADQATQVDIRGVDPGTWLGRQPSELMAYPAIHNAALCAAFLRNARRAAREGYDAFLVGTYIEPFLRELRAAVDIPVLSSLEATLLVGCSMGRRIGIVTLNDAVRGLVCDAIDRHGLGGRIAQVALVEPGLTERELTDLFAQPDAYLERFRAAVRRCVAAGADVIIPAETILAEIVTQRAIVDIDGATVLDGVGVPLAYTESIVRLWHRTGLRPGRRWSYPMPPADVLTAFETRWQH